MRSPSRPLGRVQDRSRPAARRIIAGHRAVARPGPLGRRNRGCRHSAWPGCGPVEPVLAKIRLTCVLTVASLTNSSRAICRLDLPAAMRRSTSDSRGRQAPLAVVWRRGGCARGGRQQPLLDPRIQDGLAGGRGLYGPADLGPGGILVR